MIGALHRLLFPASFLFLFPGVSVCSCPRNPKGRVPRAVPVGEWEIARRASSEARQVGTGVTCCAGRASAKYIFSCGVGLSCCATVIQAALPSPVRVVYGAADVPTTVVGFPIRASRLAADGLYLTSSMPLPVPRLREYFLSVGLFQCSWTPRLSRPVPSASGS